MKISIVIATYQRKDGSTPKYLTRALDSVFNQTHQDFKIFLIGDKYEDNDEIIKIVSKYDNSKLHFLNLEVAKERDFYTDKWAIWSYGGVNAINTGIDISLSEGYIELHGILSVSNTTNSTSTTTGALVVSGGAGIGGNLHVAGEIVAEKLTIQFTTVTTTLIQTDDVIQTLNTTNATSTTTGALKVAGGAGIGGNIHIGGSITSNDNVYSSNNASISSTSTTTVDTFDKTVYRLSKYVIQVSQSTNYQASEIMILHNGTEAFITEYGVIRSNSNLATFSTDINGNNVRLLVNMSSSTAATIKLNRISILV
jgi:glycosyltransferase involved in cell wall biosynthesis